MQNFKTWKKDTEISKFPGTGRPSLICWLGKRPPPPPPPSVDAHARSNTHLRVQSAIAALNVAGEMTLHIASTTEVKSGWDATGNWQFI